MAKDDLFSVLSRRTPATPHPSPPAPPSETHALPQRADPGRASSLPHVIDKAAGVGGRDRTLLVVLVGLAYSLALLGIGIYIGRARSPSPAVPGQDPGVHFPIDRSIRAIELLSPGAEGKAKDAEKALRQRFPEYRDQIFRQTQGRSLWICIGRFRSAVAGDRSAMEKLQMEVSKCSFESGKDRNRFKPEAIDIR